MHTWGISGPQFLLIYLVLLAGVVLAVVLVRRWVLAADGVAVPARLDLYEIAELNGGGALVATTAVSSLLRKGGLTSSGRRRSQPARLVAGTAPGADAHPVEWAVYQQVAAGSNSWSPCWSSPWWSRPCSPCGSPTPPSWAGAPSSGCGRSSRGRPPGPPRPS